MAHHHDRSPGGNQLGDPLGRPDRCSGGNEDEVGVDVVLIEEFDVLVEESAPRRWAEPQTGNARDTAPRG
jgi:hypothetical protein